ncbi:MAG: MFS transporter [Cyclobacteriaceae bacterium]|nr:MFS transporter [Cyclobacteriaceae bacterium]
MNNTNRATQSNDTLLFWGCFIALAATGFGFVARTQIISEWALEFNLTETQKGEILGVGFWPFAISIVLFSMVIDKIGYRNAMLFGVVCHIISAFMTIFANGYEMLYMATFIMALGNGTVESYINPVVATMYNRDKTKWLNILHAGWPAGIVIGGVLVIAVNSMSWQVKVALIFIPVIAYLFMLLGRTFPVNERVAAGVSYREMLKEVGIVGALIISSLISAEIGVRFGLPTWAIVLAVAVLTGAYGYFARSVGNGLFLLLVVIMIPLATTELGTDSWITSLMELEFAKFGQDSLWLLIYTSAIMAILRLFSGPIVHKLSPLGLLAVSAFLAALGLIFLSKSSGIMILAASTLYGFGKTFFWPTTLGVVAERFPKGGAMTLNGISGVGMLGIGIVGAVFLGNIQDRAIDKGALSFDENNGTALHETYVSQEKKSIFGSYHALNNTELINAPDEDKAAIASIRGKAKKEALSTVAVFPIFMLICYIGLILYFRSKGGYKPIELEIKKDE